MAIYQKPVLKGPNVTLRDVLPSDVAGRMKLGNTAEIHKAFGADPAQMRPLTEAAAAAWVEHQRAEKYGWIIEVDGQLIGAIRLHSLNPADMHAMLGIGILDADRLGQGFGTEAMRVLADHAFGPMGLHRIGVRVLAFNARAIAAYRKVGFVEEGRERHSARIGDTWHDDIIMGLLAHELIIGVAA